MSADLSTPNFCGFCISCTQTQVCHVSGAAKNFTKISQKSVDFCGARVYNFRPSSGLIKACEFFHKLATKEKTPICRGRSRNYCVQGRNKKQNFLQMEHTHASTSSRSNDGSWRLSLWLYCCDDRWLSILTFLYPSLYLTYSLYSISSRL